MTRLLWSAAFTAALAYPADSRSAEFPFSPPMPAGAVFAGAVPTIADMPLGSPYEMVLPQFLDLGKGFSISKASRELELGNDADGMVQFTFPETLHAETTGKVADYKEERTAVFSSPLTGSRLLIVERRLDAVGDNEFSIPAFEKAIVSSLGKPTGRYTATTPKLSFVWVDGVLVAPEDIPELETTPRATMEAIGKPDDALSAFERKVDSCAGLARFVENDALMETINAMNKSEPVPEHCTATATVTFYIGSQDDLSRSILVHVAYTGAIVEDAKSVQSYMKSALKSGLGKKSGIAINDF